MDEHRIIRFPLTTGAKMAWPRKGDVFFLFVVPSTRSHPRLAPRFTHTLCRVGHEEDRGRQHPRLHCGQAEQQAAGACLGGSRGAQTTFSPVNSNLPLILLTESQIKDAVKRLYEANVMKVNTLIRCVAWFCGLFEWRGCSSSTIPLFFPLPPFPSCSPDGQKKAYVRLHPDQEAFEIANKVCRISRVGLFVPTCNGTDSLSRSLPSP